MEKLGVRVRFQMAPPMECYTPPCRLISPLGNSTALCRRVPPHGMLDDALHPVKVLEVVSNFLL